MSSAMGVPVVLPSNTPERISTVSDSCRCVTWRDVPGLRLSRSCWRSASHNASPGGHPSTTQPIAAPCDSPNEVTVNKVPKVFPDILYIPITDCVVVNSRLPTWRCLVIRCTASGSQLSQPPFFGTHEGTRQKTAQSLAHVQW